jgi:hypothetical protein
MEGIDLLSAPDIETEYAFMGYDRAALVRCWPAFTTLEYAWPQDYPGGFWTSVSEHVINRETHESHHDGRINVLFDGSSGRIILSSNESKVQYLIRIGSLQ